MEDNHIEEEEKDFGDNSAVDPKAFVNFVVSSLVNKPEELDLTFDEEEEGVFTINIRCHESDFGRIIGKRGKTIQALRLLVNNLARRSNRRIQVEVVE